MSNFINVDNLYYAVLSGDDKSGVQYATPKPIPGVVKLSVDATTGRASFYADGIIQEYSQVLGEVKVSLGVSTLPLSVVTDLLGHKLNNGEIVYESNDRAPYVALMYKREKSNGKARYIKILKCLFGDSKDDAESSAATPKFQSDTLDGVAMPRAFDKQWKRMADEEETGYVDVSATWFTSVEDVTSNTKA